MKKSDIINIIKEYNLAPSKKFGQNFLIDENICRKIIDSANISESDHLMEIGPGLGSLTRYLVDISPNLTVVEIDSGFVKYLKNEFSDNKNLNLIHQDFLKLNPSGEINKIISNLPYYCSSEILFRIASGYTADEIYVMLQKEMAARLTASPGTENYGAITVTINFYFDTEILFDIGKGCFYPAPEVHSSFLKLTRKSIVSLNKNEIDLFHRIVKAAFWGRRKTLYKTFLKSPHMDIDKSTVEEVFSEIGIDRTIRGEKLSSQEFVEITKILYSKLN